MNGAGLNRDEGSGLWIVGAFMNHQASRDKMQNYVILRGSAAREFFGMSIQLPLIKPPSLLKNLC